MPTSYDKYVDVLILFAGDIDGAKSFYREVLGLAPDRHDNDFRLGETLIILLDVRQAEDQIRPAKVAGGEAGKRLQVTISVRDVAEVCADLSKRGVRLVDGPGDRAPAKRTACFADPAGVVWELAEEQGVAERAEESPGGSAWDRADKNIGRVTMLVDNLHRATSFYREVFGIPAATEVSGCATFRFANMTVALVDVASGRKLTGMSAGTSADAGSRFMITNFMDPDLCDVDVAATELAAHGVALLSGPADRPWGKRTVTFADAGGCLWELVQNVAAT